MSNRNISITQASKEGLQVTYRGDLSASAQIGITWDNGLGGGIAMSIEQAKELQELLGCVLSQVPAPIPTTYKVTGLRWPETLGDWELMGPPNNLGSWRWYRQDIAVNGLSVASRIKIDNQLQPIWDSLVKIDARPHQHRPAAPAAAIRSRKPECGAE